MIILLGENLKNLRKEKNIKQEQLAEHLNVATNTIHSWESGRTKPSYDIIKDIAEFFEVSTDRIIGGKEAENLEKIKNILKENGMWDFDKNDIASDAFKKISDVLEIARLLTEKDTEK